MMEIDQLRREIRALRQRNHENELFFPIRSLNACLTRSAISDILRTTSLEAWGVPEIVDMIENGGHKVFAILVLLKKPDLIGRFLQYDHFTERSLDMQIPFPRQALDEIIPEIADEFEEQQWEFAIPIFSQRLFEGRFPRDSRMPFVGKSRELGRGAFGRVWEVHVPAGHHSFDGTDPSQVQLSLAENRPVLIKLRRPHLPSKNLNKITMLLMILDLMNMR